MNVTVNTDASFNAKYKRGTYAFWITCDAGRHRQSDQLRGKVESPQEAEFKAIINALDALSRYKFGFMHLIIVNTDCLHVIEYIAKCERKGQTAHLHELFDLYKFYKTMIAKLPASKIEFRHVKAHTNAEDKRSFVNDWCDKAAKRAMGELLKSLKS
jgi:ribonuclease HI